MAKRDTILDTLGKLSGVRDEPKSEVGRKLLTDALAKGEGLVVARAAGIIADAACGPEQEGGDFDPSFREEIRDVELAREFSPLVVAAFERLCAVPTRDRNAPGKLAAVRALNRMELTDAELFLRAARLRQMDPVCGGFADVAAPIRVEGMFGLVRLRYPGRMPVLVDGLWDDLQDCRVGAVRAAVYDGSETAEMIIRMKALAGDKGEDFPAKPPDGGVLVLGEVFTGLLMLGRASNVSFVRRFLSGQPVTDGVRDQAAMALGGCRLPEGLAALAEEWSGSVEHADRERILYSVALNGTDEAMALLARWVGDADKRTASLYRGVLESLWGEGSPRVDRLFGKKG